MKEENQAYLVISIAFCGAAAGALSLVMQKNAHKKTEQSGKSAYKNLLWLSGLLLLIISQIIYVGVLPFADFILFSTTGAITLVCNAVFSAYLLGEVFTRYDLLATSFILVGSFAIILQTHKEQKEIGKEYVVEIMHQPTQYITIFSFYSYVLGVYLFDKYIQSKIDQFYLESFNSDPLNTTEDNHILQKKDDNTHIKQYQPSYRQLIELISSNSKDALTSVSPSFGNLQLFVKLPMLFMALACGSIAAMNGIYFKLAGELIESNSNEYNSFADWMMYSFVVLGVMGALIQLVFLQKMMQKYDQMQTMPIFYGSMILFEIYAGLYLLDESLNYTRMEIFGLYLGGIVATLGIQVIMRKPTQSSLNDKSVINQSQNQSFHQKNDKLNQTFDYQRYYDPEINRPNPNVQIQSCENKKTQGKRFIFENLLEPDQNSVEHLETTSSEDRDQEIQHEKRVLYERLRDMRREQKYIMLINN